MLHEHERQREQAHLDRARDDYRVILWRDWYRSKGMSKDTAQRLRKKGEGPKITHMTERLFGVTVRDDREWTESRIRDSR
jgi:hypothetical protein